MFPSIYKITFIQDDHILTRCHAPRPYFQLRSQSQVPGVRMSACVSWETDSSHTGWQTFHLKCKCEAADSDLVRLCEEWEALRAQQGAHGGESLLSPPPHCRVPVLLPGNREWESAREIHAQVECLMGTLEFGWTARGCQLTTGKRDALNGGSPKCQA